MARTRRSLRGSVEDVERGKEKQREEEEKKKVKSSLSGRDTTEKTHEQRTSEGEAYIKQREKLASQRGIIPREAGRELIGQEQEALKEELNAKELATLEEEQLKREEEIEQRIEANVMPERTLEEAQTKAGQILIGDVLGFLAGDKLKQNFLEGAEREFIEKEGQKGVRGIPRKLTSKVFQGIGRLGNVRVLDFSLSDLSLGDAASENIANLEGDAAKITKESNRVLAMTLTRSDNRPPANLQQGIEKQKVLLQRAETRYNKAIISLKESPEDIGAGLDLSDAMSADLNTIRMNLGMMERFQVTGDNSEILTSIGGAAGIAAFANEE